MATVASSSASTPVQVSSPSQNINLTAPSGIQVGDLLILFYKQIDNNTFSQITPSGWTLGLASGTSSPSNVAINSYYKIADATDVATATYTFNIISTTAPNSIVLVSMLRVTGIIGPNPFIAINTGGTVTPTQNSLLIIAAAESNQGPTPITPTYAIATSNPTWVPVYNATYTAMGGYQNFNLAYGNRSATTATGSASISYSPPANANILQFLSINAPVFVTATETVTTTDASIGLMILITLREVVTTVESIVSATIRMWTNAVKHASTWLDQTKH